MLSRHDACAREEDNHLSAHICRVLLPTIRQMPGRAIDDAWQAGVLDLLQGHDDSENWNDEEERVIPRDDAYLLARFAAGIRSPRIGKLRLAQLGSFGCCAHCPFPDLLERAQAAVGD